MNVLSHRFCVAPMMEWTDRHCRAFHRALSRHARLYTEMVTSKAVIHGKRDLLLGFNALEHPVALQLGGSEPGELAASARIAEDWGYDEVNLNCGCPSDRVQSGRFGACLMVEPDLVAECMAAMMAVVSIPVTVKCRIGIDDQDPHEALFRLVEACAEVGVSHFIVHARKAWLKGLSPKENRDIPPLDYALVHALKAAHPRLTIILNGGLADLGAAEAHMGALDGVMLGRAAYHNPALLGHVDRLFYGEDADMNPFQALDAYRPYMAACLDEGVPLHAMTRHMLGLMHGLPGARRYRQILTLEALKPKVGLEVLDHAVEAVHEATEAARQRREAYEQSRV